MHVRRVGAVVNRRLQRAGGWLHRLGADVPRHALEGMREPLGKCDIAPGQSVGDLLDRRALLFDELAKQLQVELSIPADTGQPVLGVEAGDRRKVARIVLRWTAVRASASCRMGSHGSAGL